MNTREGALSARERRRMARDHKFFIRIKSIKLDERPVA